MKLTHCIPSILRSIIKFPSPISLTFPLWVKPLQAKQWYTCKVTSGDCSNHRALHHLRLHHIISRDLWMTYSAIDRPIGRLQVNVWRSSVLRTEGRTVLESCLHVSVHACMSVNNDILFEEPIVSYWTIEWWCNASTQWNCISISAYLVVSPACNL